MAKISKFKDMESGLIKVGGILDFNPTDRTKKHISQSAWKRVALIKTKCELDNYYAWFLKKRFNLELSKNLRGSHVTIINDKIRYQDFERGSEVFHRKPIDFFYNPKDIRSNGKHWWISVSCPDAESIRESMGLDKIQYFGFHLTIGYANEKNEAHSQYILNQILRFGI